jgi:hypothetical protein
MPWPIIAVIGVLYFAVAGYISWRWRYTPKPVSAKKPKTRTTTQLRSSRVSPTASGGGLGSGLLALAGGLYLHNHYGPIAQVCHTGLGAIAQSFEPHSTECTKASLLSEVGTILTIGGAVVVVMTLLVILSLLFDAHNQTGR